MSDSNRGLETSPPKLGDPDYVFPKEVHNLLVSAYSGNMGLSAMADSKASMLMGASFVVFGIAIGDIVKGEVSLPLLVLTLFAFGATVLGVLTVRPTRMRTVKIDPGKANVMFFGSFTNISREEYIEQVIGVLSSEEETYRRMAGDIYDHGCLLKAEKYKWLYWSFTLFLVGLVVTFLVVLYEMFGR